MRNSQETTTLLERAERDSQVPLPRSSPKSHPARRWNVLASLRRLHLYLGIFSAPAILFFAFTGILQTLSLHESSHDGSYRPPEWIVVLAQIHKKQTPLLPPKRVFKPDTPKGTHTEQPSTANPANLSKPHNSAPMKAFFVVIGFALIASTLSGMVMAWKFRRDRILLWILLIAGIAVPLLLLVI